MNLHSNFCDDFGNQLSLTQHWTGMVQGTHSMGLYGYADLGGNPALEAVDFDDLEIARYVEFECNPKHWEQDELDEIEMADWLAKITNPEN